MAGALLLASRGHPRKGAQAAAAPSAVAGLALHAQLGFTDPLLGGTATSAAYLLSVAVVAGCLGWDTNATPWFDHHSPR